MLARCLNARHQSFPGYGGAGVRVDPRWRDFTTFLADLGERPPGTTLDRINGNKGYELGNVRWASRAVQTANRDPARLRAAGRLGAAATNRDPARVRASHLAAWATRRARARAAATR